MPKVIVMRDPATAEQIPLRIPETKIGRAPTNDIAIDHEQVSRVHASLVVDGPFVTLTDLDSRNGVFVNGVRVASQMLVTGDEIRIGNCLMRFVAGEQDFTSVEALRLLTVPGLLVDLDSPRVQLPPTPPRREP
ncbi:FHA domain-containing protein [Burkholderiales bacterium 8X]|nr:FHA domain-containing protein [Burkholderiales bacterium 8X]